VTSHQKRLEGEINASCFQVSLKGRSSSKNRVQYYFKIDKYSQSYNCASV